MGEVPITRCVCHPSTHDLLPLYVQNSRHVMIITFTTLWLVASSTTGVTHLCMHWNWTKNCGRWGGISAGFGTLILYTGYLHRYNTVGMHYGGEHGLQKWGTLGFYDRRQIPCFGSSIYFKGGTCIFRTLYLLSDILKRSSCEFITDTKFNLTLQRYSL